MAQRSPVADGPDDALDEWAAGRAAEPLDVDERTTDEAIDQRARTLSRAGYIGGVDAPGRRAQ
jgi:hypothetical protein